MPAPSSPCVLVVADPERVPELAAALAGLQPIGTVDVVTSHGGDDTIELFEARRPEVVVVTASLDAGDAPALIGVLRGMVPRAEVAVVVVGDDAGPIRTALDADELAPDSFITRPLEPRALRFAVARGLDAVLLVRPGAEAGGGADEASSSDDADQAVGPAPVGGAADAGDPAAMAPPPAVIGALGTAPGTAAVAAPVLDEATVSNRSALRARLAALADAFTDEPEDGAAVAPAAPSPIEEEAAPLPPPLEVAPRWSIASLSPPVAAGAAAVAPPAAWAPGNTAELGPEPPSAAAVGGRRASDRGADRGADQPDDRAEPPASVRWVTASSSPTREPTLVLHSDDEATHSGVDAGGHLDDGIGREDDDPPTLPPPLPGERARMLDDFDDELVMRSRPGARRSSLPSRFDDLGELDELGGGPSGDGAADRLPAEGEVTPLPVPTSPPLDRPGGRDFARELRQKMSMMAQRLFKADPAAVVGSAGAPVVDVAPRHDHHTEIDLAALGEEPALGGGVTEIEAREAPLVPDMRELREREPVTSPGSWDTSVRDRGLPEAGELVRGLSDAAHLIARMSTGEVTGRLTLRRDGVEKVIYFDHGRPVFAASTEAADRMGLLLVREGKITATHYTRCQAIVIETGRRMGEILVDLGYLKRRELLPAVRRHVEDIIYSLFGWDHGHYRIQVDAEPSTERIRLSRHPAALILEGIRRKFDRESLERLLGPSSTVIELADRERLAALVALGELGGEERTTLAAFDGQADLAGVARAASVELVDVLPLAWGLCALGIGTARRAEHDAVADDAGALVGETDLAIDRERVRSRWQLVEESDYFALLGVRRDATAFEIRRAYQAARRDFAAEGFPTELRLELGRELEDIGQVLDEAYRILRDDRLRAAYLRNLVE